MKYDSNSSCMILLKYLYNCRLSQAVDSHYWVYSKHFFNYHYCSVKNSKDLDLSTFDKTLKTFFFKTIDIITDIWMTKKFHLDEPTSINKTRSWTHVMSSTRSERFAKVRLAFVLLPEKTETQLETRGSPLHDISTHIRLFCRRIGWLIRCSGWLLRCWRLWIMGRSEKIEIGELYQKWYLISFFGSCRIKKINQACQNTVK